MKRYAFIQNGIITGIIEGKDDNSRDWKDYYSKSMGMQCVAIPNDRTVSTGNSYINGEFQNEIEQWRQTAKLTSRKFWLGVEFYPYNDGKMLDAINTAIQGLRGKMKKKVQIELQKTHEFNRNAKSTLMMIQAIGMTPKQADEFFRWAENEEWDNE